MKNTWTKELILIIITILPIVYVLLVWDALPETIATHFDFEGNANGFTKKSHIVWLISGVMIFSYVLMKYLPKIDPKNKIENMGKKYFKIKLLLISLLSSVFSFVIYIAINENANSKIFILILGSFLIVMGNFMQTIKPNYFLGMRTPWTLQSEVVWKKTHKIAGKIMIITGLIFAISFFVTSGRKLEIIIILSLILTIVIPFVYSYVIFKKLESENI